VSTTLHELHSHAERSWFEIAPLIDHTLLKPETTQEQIIQLCEEAARYRFACAFVNPTWAALAVSALAGTGVHVGAPVGFPLGATLATSKRTEALELVRLGVHDLDMVMNIGALKSGDRNTVLRDIEGVTEIAHDAGAIVKVILETCLLTIDEKIVACELAALARADFVKTSTGLSTAGATTDDVALMPGVVGSRAGVKASGGIRTVANVLAMIDAGANRIGTSSGVQIVAELGAR